MVSKKVNVREMITKLLNGDRRAAARLITLVEDGVDEHHDIMRRIYPHTGHALIIGITGAGGAGKSSLTDHLIRKFREKNKKVGVVVVDPSSPFSGGAFLGDRIRLQNHSQDDGVYIRSMASRGNLGGLSRATYDVIRIQEALGMEVIFVETLGAGQDEIDIVQIATTCLLVVTPGMGDDIQAMKAGIMEIADIIVLNKADLEGATTCLRQLEGVLAVSHESESSWNPRIVPTVSVASKPENLQGIDALMQAIVEHQQYLQSSRQMDHIKFARVEHELGLIFKDEVQKFIFKGLRGTGKKKKYIHSIIERRTDPYSVVEEVLSTYFFSRK